MMMALYGVVVVMVVMVGRNDTQSGNSVGGSIRGSDLCVSVSVRTTVAAFVLVVLFCTDSVHRWNKTN